LKRSENEIGNDNWLTQHPLEGDDPVLLLDPVFLGVVAIISALIGILGGIPGVAWLRSWTERSITGRLSWNEVFEMIDSSMSQLKKAEPTFQPDTIVAIGRGGTLMATYLAMYFQIKRIHTVHLSPGYGAQVRALDSSGLNRIEGDEFLVVTGISDTGFALATVRHILESRGDSPRVRTYAFWAKRLESSDAPDSVLDVPNYCSTQRRRVILPWYKQAGGPILEGGVQGISVNGVEGRLVGISIDTTRMRPPLTTMSDAVVRALATAIRTQAASRDPYNIVIAGPAGVGKSEFATCLKAELGNATHLPLDASILDAEARDADLVDGCQIKAYDLEKVKEWSRRLANREKFEIAPFDHALRRTHGSHTVDGSQKYRLIEWLFATSPKAIPGDFTIVLDAPPEARFRFWHDRYERVRGVQVTNAVLDSINSRLKSTTQEIDPYLSHWDARMVIDSYHNVARIDSNSGALSSEILAILKAS
jgi:hypoxanthine phosphoribosyltransferase